MPVNATRMEPAGPPVPVITNVQSSPNNGSASIHAAMDGTLLYRASSEGAETGLAWIDETGKTEPLAVPPGHYRFFELSPEGRRLATHVEGGGLAVLDLERKTMSRLAAGGEIRPNQPIWTRSGRHVLYSLPSGIFAIPADGASAPAQVTTGEFDRALSLSPDDGQLYFSRGDGHAKVALDWCDPGRPKPGNVEPVVLEGITAGSPMRLSPDGRWLAYMSDSGRNLDIFVRSTAVGSGGRWQISSNGGSGPEWSPNGRELLYRDVQARTVSVPFTLNGDSFVPGSPRFWPVSRFGAIVTDGKRMLIPMLPEGVREGGSPGQVVMLLNFLDELQRKVTVKQ